MTARVTLKTLFYLMLTVFALVSFGPVIWLLLTSIKPYRDIEKKLSTREGGV